MKFKSIASPAVLRSGKEDNHCSTLLYCSKYVRVRTSGDSSSGCGG